MACQTTQDCCFLFRGKMYVAKRKDCCPAFKEEEMQFVGNVLDLTINQSVNKIAQKNYTSVSGGNYCTVYEIEEANLALTFGCSDRKVFEIVTAGAVELKEAAAAITDEIHATKGGEDHIYLSLLPDTTVAPVVTSEDTLTTYVEGTDYNVSAYGIEVIEGGQIDLDAQAAVDGEINILVDYTHSPQTVVEGLASTGSDYYVVLEGVDKVSSRPVRYIFPKVRFSPSSSVPVITEELAQFEAEGELFDDPCGDIAGKYQVVRGA